MNLLPKSHKQFSEKDYWNSFFETRGAKSFEWYGEYLELCSQLHKYMKKSDEILITGCGNSKLSADLYDVGFKNIRNIDISEVVIKQMTKINSSRENMKFLCMDALNMSFEDNIFNVVLDKGTLDALMPDNSPEVNERIDKYFNEVKRILKFGGRYLCVSLLQEHILDKFLDGFADASWMVRVVRCREAEAGNTERRGSALPVFMVVASKFKQLPRPMLEVCMGGGGEKATRVDSAAAVRAAVLGSQRAAAVTAGVASTTLAHDDEVCMEVSRPGDTAPGPRYTLHVLDSPRGKLPYAVFVVPQGREIEWMFGTAGGRRQLAGSAGARRLLVASLHRGHAYGSLDEVRLELRDAAASLAPRRYTGQIPFLSVGADVGRREVVWRGCGGAAGPLVVEDVDVEGARHRRLVFLDSQHLVQSEARLRYVSSTSSWEVDTGYLASEYHWYMSVGCHLAATSAATSVATSAATSNATLAGAGASVAIIGVGGGALCSFLRRRCGARVTAVDIDPAVPRLAADYFALAADDKLRVLVRDGIDFLAAEADNGARYDAVVFDVDSKDRSVSLSCPPAHFLQDAPLDHVARLIGETGHFILNLVCREAELQNSIKANLRRKFRQQCCVTVAGEVNQVLYCSNAPRPYTRPDVERAARDLNNNNSSSNNNNNNNKCSSCDVADLMKALHLE